MEDLQRVEVKSRRELRAWLSKHHGQKQSIWLVTFKKSTGARYIPYGEIVEEALCFGWIDSRPRGLDNERTMLLLSPRKRGSAWSNANKTRVASLIARGLMTEFGLAKIDAAKADGSWEFLDDVHNGEIPPDLAAALRQTPNAAANFEAFSPSSKRIILEWIKRAKRPETRANRVAEAAAKAAINVRANH